jgi:hypothetical protein
VAAGPGLQEPFVVVDARGVEVESVRVWVQELVVGDSSPRTVRAY